MVGVHAAFTCRDATLEAAAGLAADLGVGVHIHVAEDPVDATPAPAAHSGRPTTGCSSTASTSTATCPAPIAHNPRSNMNNAVGYARPARFANPVVLGTDGIGADMLEEFRLAVRLREDDVTATPDGVVVARPPAGSSCPRPPTTG